MTDTHELANDRIGELLGHAAEQQETIKRLEEDAAASHRMAMAEWNFAESLRDQLRRADESRDYWMGRWRGSRGWLLAMWAVIVIETAALLWLIARG